MTLRIFVFDSVRANSLLNRFASRAFAIIVNKGLR